MVLPRRIGALLVLAILAAPVFWLYVSRSGGGPDPVLDVEGQTKLAAMRRIEAQSGGAPALPPIQAPAAKRWQSSAAEVEHDAAPPAPPPGYTFVPAPAQMTKAALPAAPAGVDTARSSATPNVELEWLGAPDAIHALAYQAEVAGRDWSFGWLRLAEGATAAALDAQLRTFGGEVLGTSGNLVRAKLPGSRADLSAINALPVVDGIGARPSERKIETLREELRRNPDAARTPVLITLMADDPDGLWRRALEDAGATVGAFHADIRAYPANVYRWDLASIAALDVVLAIDPVRVGRGALDRAAMSMGADALRTYDESAELFTGRGGASIPIGVMDSGLNINHPDISENRESICGVNLLALPFTDLQEDDADLWRDAGDHGTHVTGILLGNGKTEPHFAGMAPLVKHIRFAKVLHHETGAGSAASFMRAMDWLARATICADADNPDAPVKPLIVNMSLAASGRHFRGKEVDQRKLDATVWNHRQLYVVAQDNTGPQGFSNFAATKNSLAVGAVTNTGTLAAFSSFGPTADGRLAPQVVATGFDILSAKGDASNDEYAANSGTSMASPAAAGVAALLMDAVPKYQQQPALVRAQLMASAIKPDAWLDSAQFPASNTAGPGALQHRYGLGKVSARTSVLQRAQADGWTSGSAIVEPQASQSAYQDIEVPSGTSRLDVVMTWDERPADAIGTTVLNDLDLYLDAGADCGAGACGEHSSTSRVDNVEWLVVRDPAPGTYRVKVIGERIYTAAPRAAVAWTVIRGDSTPTLSVRADRTTLTGDGAQPLTLTITTSGYVAAGVRVSIACRTADGAGDCDALVKELRVQREDGVSVANLDAVRIQGSTDVHYMEYVTTANYSAFPLPLGEIAAGEERQVQLAVEYRASDSARLHVKVDAWNAIGASTSIEMGPSGGAADDAAPPTNHVFANAETLSGEEGEKTTDLLLARSEPGEALLREPVSFQDPTSERPSASVWYVWTAPSDGVYQFSAVRDFVPSVRESRTRVHVFHGEGIVDARRLVGETWAADALFKANERYRIRVSAADTLAPVKLRWHAAKRPKNDDFANAEPLLGADGSFDGTTWGATLERGEWLGPGAASVWHRWTAPNDGVWEFEGDGVALAVFRGETVSALRLVSGKPGGLLTLPVGAGLEYHIAALADDARLGAGATSYELRWRGTDAPFPDDPNDLFANAKEMGESASGSYDINADITATVEPGEPAETGARTRWWSWRAPSDGRITWRLDPLGFGFQVAAFAGTSLGDLELLAAGDGDRIGTLNEFAFDAESGKRYWIGAGLHPDSALGDDIATGKLEWAPTPANDGLALATAIAAASGSASGDNRWATVDGNESSRHGRSSVWWNFNAPTTGTYRFEVTGTNQTVAIYRRTGDGVAGLALVKAGGSEVTFHAVAGTRYAVRVGSLGQGGQFTLRWSQQNPDGHTGGQGHSVALFPAAATESDRVGDQELVEGFIRVINRSADSGTIAINAFDDAGVAGGSTVTMSIDPNQRRHFNSADLENGNANKGLAGAIGNGEGDWRLSLTTDLDIDVFVFARTKPGGFLTSLHDIAPCTGNRCRVAMFNPGSNVNQRSLLRLVNPAEEAAAVTITGTDDAGESPRSAVRLNLEARAATTLTAQDLEGGEREGLDGALGDGVGKWELVVEADRTIQVMNLLKSPTGHLTNLSSTGGQ